MNSHVIANDKQDFDGESLLPEPPKFHETTEDTYVMLY